MPTNGLMVHWDALELKIASSRVGTVGSVAAESLYTPDVVTLSYGCRVEISADVAGHYFLAEWPGGSHAFADTGAAAGSRSLSIVLNGFRVYGTLYQQTKTTVESIDVLIDGSIVASYTNWDETAFGTDTSVGLGPLYVWGFTGYVRVSGGTAEETFGECQISGGWRFKEHGEGSWTALPVTFPEPHDVTTTVVLTPPPFGGATTAAPFGLTLPDMLDATTTWGDLYRILAPNGPMVADPPDYKTCLGIVMIPDLSKALVRLHPDYKKLLYRTSAPLVRATGGRSGNVDYGAFTGVPFAMVGGTTDVDAYDALSEFLEEVGPSGSTLDTDVLAAPTYSCCHIAVGKWVGTENEQYSYQFPSHVDALDWLNHSSAIARYINSLWVNPWWGVWTWTQPPNGWELDGSATPWPDYWGRVCEQHLANALLPGGGSQTRNCLVSQAIEIYDPWTPWLDAFASGLRWAGVSRFKVQEHALSSSLTLTQSRRGDWRPRYQDGVPDCALVFNATRIRVSGFSAEAQADGHVELDLALGSWTVDPYMLLHLADRLTVDWDSANVTSISVHLVGSDGAETLLGATGGVAHDYPQGEQTKYAGSWGIDNGALATVDTGSDTDAGTGISASIMSDPERVFAFALGSGRAYRFLRFKIVPTSWGGVVDLHYPVFRLSSTHPSVWWESSKCAAMVWADGPGLRWGNWTWYWPGVGLTGVPLVMGLGMQNSVVDWICFRNRVLEGAGGVSLSATVAAECAAIYDSFESGNLAAADAFSGAFLLPKGTDELVRGALVNYRAELPPYCGLPFRSRDVDDWSASGPHSQELCDLAFETRSLVSSDVEPASIEDDGSTPVGAFEGSPPSGWAIWRYAPVLANDETGWRVVSTSELFAYVRPFRGWFGLLLSDDLPSGANPFYDVSSDFHHVWGYSDAGVWWMEEGRGNALPGPFVRVAQKITGDWLRLARERTSARRLLAVADAGTVELYWSGSDGGRWTLAVSLGSGGFPTVCSAPDGTVYAYWVDGTEIKGSILDAQFNVLRGPFVAKTGVDEGGIDCAWSVGASGTARVGLVWSEGGVAKIDFSETGFSS